MPSSPFRSCLGGEKALATWRAVHTTSSATANPASKIGTMAKVVHTHRQLVHSCLVAGCFVPDGHDMRVQATAAGGTAPVATSFPNRLAVTSRQAPPRSPDDEFRDSLTTAVLAAAGILALLTLCFCAACVRRWRLQRNAPAGYKPTTGPKPFSRPPPLPLPLPPQAALADEGGSSSRRSHRSRSQRALATAPSARTPRPPSRIAPGGSSLGRSEAVPPPSAETSSEPGSPAADSGVMHMYVAEVPLSAVLSPSLSADVRRSGQLAAEAQPSAALSAPAAAPPSLDLSPSAHAAPSLALSAPTPAPAGTPGGSEVDVLVSPRPADDGLSSFLLTPPLQGALAAPSEAAEQCPPFDV